MLNTYKLQLSDVRRQRLPRRNVFYYRSPDHRRNYVMSFTFCFDREDDVYQFAYSFPYTYTKLQNYLDSIEQRRLDYVLRRPLVYSVVNFSYKTLINTSDLHMKKI